MIVAVSLILAALFVTIVSYKANIRLWKSIFRKKRGFIELYN